MPGNQEIAPRDIVPIPYFALEVSLSDAAVIFGVAALLLMAAIAIRSRFMKQRKLRLYPLVMEALQDARKILLRENAHSEELKQAISLISLAVRRYLSAHEGLTLSSGSERDLREKMQSLPQGNTRSIIESLVAIEGIKYAPTVMKNDVRELFLRLEGQLQKYELSREQRS